MYERYADPVDEANALAASLTDNAIEAARRACAPETHPDFDGATCLECADDIPAGRLALGKIRCVPCQSALDQRKKRMGNFPSTVAHWDSPDRM